VSAFSFVFTTRTLRFALRDRLWSDNLGNGFNVGNGFKRGSGFNPGSAVTAVSRFESGFPRFEFRLSALSDDGEISNFAFAVSGLSEVAGAPDTAADEWEVSSSAL